MNANRKLDNAVLDVDRAERNVAAARTEFLPALNLEAGASHNFSSQDFRFDRGAFGTFPATGPIPATPTFIATAPGMTSVVSASISQPLLQLYRIGLEVDQTPSSSRWRRSSCGRSRQEIVKQVKQQYYEILKTQSSLQATEESIVFYRELSQLVATYVQQKVALEYQSLETQSRLARAEHKASDRAQCPPDAAGAAQRSARPRRQDGLRGDCRADGDADDRWTRSSAEQTALAQRPDVQEARLKLQHAQTGYRVTQSGYLPDLNLVMRYSRLFNTEFIPREIWTVGAGAEMAGVRLGQDVRQPREEDGRRAAGAERHPRRRSRRSASRSTPASAR